MITNRRLVYIAAVACMIAALSSLSAAQDVTGYRGGVEHNSYYGNSVKLPLIPVWAVTSTYTPSNTSTPVMAGGATYLVAKDRLIAVDTASGAELWKFLGPTDTKVQLSGTPTVAGDRIYIGSARGTLYAIATSGENMGNMLWGFKTQGSIPGHISAYAGNLYFGSTDGFLYSVDGASGTASWKQPCEIGDAIIGGVVATEDKLFFVAENQNIYGVTRASGSVRWKSVVTGVQSGVTPAYADGNLYVTMDDSIVALHPETGRLKWRKSAANILVGNVAAGNNKAVVVDELGNVTCWDANGVRLWTTPKPVFNTKPASGATIMGDYVLVAGSQGGIIALNSDTGERVWQFRMINQPTGQKVTGEVNMGFTASPVISNGTMVVATDFGGGVAFRTDGTDSVAPVVKELAPTRGAVVSGLTELKIKATVWDMISGVNPQSIKLTIDDQSVEYDYDDITGILTYPAKPKDNSSAGKPAKAEAAKTVKAVSAGRHNIIVSVKDWAGNLEDYSWGYFVSNTSAK